MRLLIGLDVGTSAIKGVLVSPDGKRLAAGKRAVELIHPEPGQTEIEPEGHYRSVCGLLRELAAAVPAGDSVAAVSMAFASGNTILLDQYNRPLGNIISWLDRRTAGRGAELLPGVDLAAVHRTVGWPGLDTFPLAHLAWWKRDRPQVFSRAARVAMNSDWLTWRLTGRWEMDHSTATTFYLQEQVSRRWHAPHLALLGIPEGSLSRLAASGAPVGPLTASAAMDTGLPAKTLLVLGAFDHPCAARATGILAPGDLLISCGTSWVGLYPCADRELLLSRGMLVDPFLTPRGPWAGMFALTAVGSTIEWVIDNLVLGDGEHAAEKYRVFNEAAASSPRGAGGLFLNPLWGSERLARDAGRLKASHTRAQLARAVMEGTAFEMKRWIDDNARHGLPAARIAMVGGPSESPVWPRILAEVSGLTLTLVNGQVAGAVGAAALAGMGAGIYRDEAEAATRLADEPLVISPPHEAVREYAALFSRYREAAATTAPRG